MSIIGIIVGLVIFFIGAFIAFGFLVHDPNEPIITTTVEIKRFIKEDEDADNDEDKS